MSNAIMDNRAPLEALTQNFTRESLIAFLRAASGSFRPQKEDCSRYPSRLTL
jgi:hypothetical protein